MNSDNALRVSDNWLASLALSRYGESERRVGGEVTQRIANPRIETSILTSKTRPIRGVGKSDNRPERFGNISGMLTTAFVEDAA